MSLFAKLLLTAFMDMIHLLIALGFLVIIYGYSFLSRYSWLL